MAFDPLNLLLLAIALVVFWRLRSVLGTRTGNERPPFDPTSSDRGAKSDSPSTESDKKAIRFPQQEPMSEESPSATETPLTPIWEGFAEPGSELAKTLEKITAADSSFAPKSFVEGAKRAYETIVDAFARGDKPALKNLLSRDVLDGFSKAIDQRQASGQVVESRFVGIDNASIRAAQLTDSRAQVTIEFVSEMISATRTGSGDVIEGDPTQIREITDVWTFERDVRSRDPNWKLIATEAPA
jgi:predicted lipid-binding transport protein (Tim44 family)